MTYDNCSTPSRTSTYVPYNRKDVYGIGVCDSLTPTKVNGRRTKSYTLWHAMMARCYAEPQQSYHPSYTGCSVASEWYSFSAFERWFTENYTEGWQLDKDLLVPGNKVYSPATCMFVPRQINSLLTDCARARGLYPLGVNARGAKFIAQICKGGHTTHLGMFSTPLEAHQAWQRAKLQIIADFPTTDPRIRVALDLRVAQLRDDLLHGRITVSL